MSINNYWDVYYKKHKDPNSPSPFALYIKDYLKKGQSLIEMGCGNGRDSLYFSNELGLNVTAVDQASDEIDYLHSNYANRNIVFVSEDFSKLNIDKKFDKVYSRFTLHSIDKSAELRVLKWAFKHINQNGHLFIEVRSVNDDLFGKGKKIAENSFVTDHYRRFVNKEKLVEEILKLGFEVIHQVENRELAVYKDENPVIIRVIAEKLK